MKDSVGRGAIAEMVLATEFMKKGINVYFPLTHKSKYDMIIDVQGRIRKIQVKRIYYTNNHGSKTPVMETRRLLTTRTKDSKVKAGRYVKEDYDYLIGVDVDHSPQFYTFKFEEAQKYKAQIYLKSKVNNVGLLIWD